MITIILNTYDEGSALFDIHTHTEGEMTFVISTINSQSPETLQMWKTEAHKDYFLSENNLDVEKWEIVWQIDDESGFPLAHKIYEYIKDFGFDVEIIEKNA